MFHQNWHHLLFLHWEVPAAELQALLPRRLTVDPFEGKAYVALVPFTMTGARLAMVPALPGVSSFHEINLRTYVRLDGGDPGVWFFSLDASSGIAVAGGRAMYHLPYFAAAIDFAASDDPLPLVEFRTRRTDSRGPTPAHAQIRYRPREGAVTSAQPGSIEHFLLERYLLYSEDSQHQLYRARVHHQPYPVQRGEILELDETLVWAAGIRRAEAYDFCHYAREVNVTVDAPESCAGATC